MVWMPHSLSRKPTPQRLPDGVRVYAIGDIHGRADLLREMFISINADRAARQTANRILTIFLGDYIDRGPDSRDVLDILLEYERTNETIFLKGNHETFLPNFLSDPEVLNEWRTCGGLQTLMSYGLMPSINPDADECAALSKELADALPQSHLKFLESLHSSFCCGGFLFVHAGIRPGVSLGKQTEEDCLWIRDDFLSYEKQFEKFVVHGHTPVMNPDIRSNRANIDTGAFASGRLTCIAIEGSIIVSLSAPQTTRRLVGEACES
jgi:serine/threonine protein phosphatase 1